MNPLLRVLLLLCGLASVHAATPLSVTDLQIQLVDSAHVRLSWSPVLLDTTGLPLADVFYELHLGLAPDFVLCDESRVASTFATVIDHALPSEQGFFRVRAQSCEAIDVPHLLPVRSGSFTMGEMGRFASEPPHPVTLTHDFLLGRTEVTNAQYVSALNWALAQGLVTVANGIVWQDGVELLRVNSPGGELSGSFEISYNPQLPLFHVNSPGWSGDPFPSGPGHAYPGGYDPADHPVKCVSWYGAACYCDWLSQMEGLPPYYQGQWSQIPSPRNPYDASGYRLPTEAEWERAARFDDGRSYPWGGAQPNCTLASYMYSAPYVEPYLTCVGWSHPVGSRPAGGSYLGFQDMADNVSEWTNDGFEWYTETPQVNPALPASGSNRIFRGGSFGYYPMFLACASRLYSEEGSWDFERGFRVCRTQSFNMVRIPAGGFTMGQVGVAVPEHAVTLDHDFLLGQSEVTNAQFLEALNWAQAQGLVSVVGDYVTQYGVNLMRINMTGEDRFEIRYNPDTQQFYLHAGTWELGNSYGPGEAYPSGYDPANHPVKNLTWYGAACYCDWRSQMIQLPPYYNGQWEQIPSPNNPYTATGYRLPTEAEWEFAAQHDDERIYPWGSQMPTCTRANCYSNGLCVGWTSPVGSHPTGTSRLGLQDMAGNVYEWCNDRHASYGSSPQSNPAGPVSGIMRVVRGGSWGENGSEGLQCARRIPSYPSSTDMVFGFRMGQSIP